MHTFIAIVVVVVVVFVVVVIVSSNIYYAKREITESEQSTEQTTLTTYIDKSIPPLSLFTPSLSTLSPVIKPTLARAENMHFSSFPRHLIADEQMLIKAIYALHRATSPTRPNCQSQTQFERFVFYTHFIALN